MDPTIKRSLRYSSKGYQLDPPALVHPNILVGAGEMLTPAFAKKYGITHVINCAEDAVSPSWFRDEFPTRYYCLNAVDALNVNILKWYPEFKAIMKAYLQHPESKAIFVHCQCGINRSAFLAMMYACDVFKFKYADTELAIIRQRPCALTNVSFQKQVFDALSKDGKY
jgi:hypothetical protein